MKRNYSVLLALLLLLMASPSAAAPAPTRLAAGAGDAVAGAREETVYLDIQPDGTVDEVIAVVRLRVDRAGNYTDYGAYSSVSNLTNALVPVLASDGVSWSFPEAYPAFTYQGTLKDPTLPFSLSIAYTLDGREVPPDELAGTAGEVGIRIELTRTSGISPYFEKQFMAQLQLTFPADSCTVVENGGAAAVLSGSSRILTFNCLPGQNLTASVLLDASSFELSQASLAMMPYDIASMLSESMPELDLTELSSGLDELTSGLEALKSGTEELKTGATALNDGAASSAEAGKKLKDAASQLYSGMSQLGTALAEYETLFATYITGGDQFLKIFNSLSAGAKELSSGIAQLSTGLDTLSQSAGQLPAGAQELIDGEAALLTGFGELRTALEAVPSQLGAGDSDKTPAVSYVNGSPDITSVQFAGSIRPITVPKAEKEAPPPEEPSSLWDKLTGLFR